MYPLQRSDDSRYGAVQFGSFAGSSGSKERNHSRAVTPRLGKVFFKHHGLEEKVKAMDTLNPEIARLFAAKEARRHKLAALPFPEKVRAVVRLQEIVAPLLRARGRIVRVWKLDGRVA